MGANALVYLDDILIFGQTIEHHSQNLKDVLQRLKDANLVCQPEKCVFA